MVKRPRMVNAKVNLGKTAGDIGRFARSTSVQLAEQVSDLKDSAVGSIENLAEKKPDEYEEAIAGSSDFRWGRGDTPRRLVSQ